MYIAKQHNPRLRWLLAYIVFVCGIDNLYNLFIDPHIDPNNIALTFVNPLFKLLCWLLPTFLYIRYIEQANPLTYLKLTMNIRKGLFWGCLIGCLLVPGMLYHHLVMGAVWHMPNFGEWVNVVLLVGFMEEIPFRGFVFQQLQSYLGFWWGAILSSLIFLELHFVYWYTIGEPLMYFVNGGAYIFIFAVVACTLLKRTGSLWSSIVFHALNDLISLL